MTDQQLLREYVNSRSQEAFAELVRRHGDWVYWAAVREVRDPALAQDVSQAVFWLLAQKAAKLGERQEVGRWLLKAVGYAGSRALRGEHRRKLHEKEATAMKQQISETLTPGEWEQLAPMLENLVRQLSGKDQQAILLRFYRQLSFADVAAELGVSEDAAKKRTGRAVGKLRQLMQKKGLLVSAGALSACLLDSVTQAAPVGLAAKLVAVAAPGSLIPAAVTAIGKGAWNMIRLMQAKVIALAVVAAMLLVAPPAVWLARGAQSPSPQAATQPAPVQWPDVVANSRSAEWVHTRSNMEGKDKESWFAANPYRSIDRYVDRIEYQDGSTNRQYLYDVAQRLITVGPLPRDLGGLRQKQTFLDMMLAAMDLMQKSWGTPMTQKQEVADGKMYTVFTVSAAKDPGYVQVRVDPKSKRIDRVVVQLSAGQGQPQPATVMDLDYPQAGPGDIYAAGAPSDAKVLDLTPSKEVQDLDNKVSAAMEAFAPQYYAVICLANEDNATGIPIFSAVWKKGGKYRIQNYVGDARDVGKAGQMSLDDFKAVEAMLVGRPVSSVRFITSRKADVTVSLGSDGTLTKGGDRDALWDSVMITGTVEGIAWHAMRWTRDPESVDLRVGEMNTIELSEDSTLVTREQTTQAVPWRYPSRTRESYDPHHDYICARYDWLATWQPDWQRDPQSLKTVLKEIGSDRDVLRFRQHMTRRVLEYAQTPQGRWYPKKMIEEFESAGKDRNGGTVADEQLKATIIRIHLATQRDIPDELLDPERVDPALFQVAGKPGSSPQR